MSDEDKDIDVESDDDEYEISRSASSLLQGRGGDYMSQAEKRAHHNALERKRRDHIKDSFHNLRDAVPSIQGEKASRAHILKSATEYIQFMTKKNTAVQGSIDDLKRENRGLENQVRQLDRAKAAGLYAQQSSALDEPALHLDDDDVGEASDSAPEEEDEEEEEDVQSDTDYHFGGPHKKLKT